MVNELLPRFQAVGECLHPDVSSMSVVGQAYLAVLPNTQQVNAIIVRSAIMQQYCVQDYHVCPLKSK
jgi:hypothetical protein